MSENNMKNLTRQEKTEASKNYGYFYYPDLDKRNWVAIKLKVLQEKYCSDFAR